MSLVGRGEEKQQVDRLLSEAAEERGGAHAERGEPGIGKSVLLDYAVSVRTQRGWGWFQMSELIARAPDQAS